MQDWLNFPSKLFTTDLYNVKPVLFVPITEEQYKNELVETKLIQFWAILSYISTHNILLLENAGNLVGQQ